MNDEKGRPMTYWGGKGSDTPGSGAQEVIDVLGEQLNYSVPTVTLCTLTRKQAIAAIDALRASSSEIKDTAPSGTPRDGVTARRDAPLWKPTSAKYEHPLAWESNVTGKVYVACVGRDGNTYQVELEKP